MAVRFCLAYSGFGNDSYQDNSYQSGPTTGGGSSGKYWGFGNTVEKPKQDPDYWSSLSTVRILVIQKYNNSRGSVL